MDQFQNDYTRAQQKHTDLKKLIKERNEASKAGQSIAKFSYLVSQGVTGLKNDIQSFERLSYMYQNPMAQQTSQSSNLSSKDKAKRLRMIQDFKESCQFTIHQYEESEQKKKVSGGDLEDQEPLVRGEDGEYNMTRGASNQQLKMKQQQMIANQDEQLEEIYGVTKAIKYEGQNMDTELKTQAVITENLKDEMDKNTMKMVKLDNRLKHLVANSSPCKLMMLIFCEFIVLIVLICVL